MRWITVLIFWIVAVLVALMILRRVRRGKPVVLTGRWSPRVVRMIAVVLVVVGVDEQPLPDATAAPAKLPIRGQDDQLPATIKPYTIETWLIVHQENSRYAVARQALVRALAGRPLTDKQLTNAKDYAGYLRGTIQKLVLADLAAIAEKKPLPAASDADLRAALDELEKNGQFDHVWNAYLWRKASAEPKDMAVRIELFARIRQHARITDALIRAYAQVKPLMQPPRAWGSKAGPKPGDMGAIKAYQASLTDMLKAANDVLPTTDEGTWKRDGVALIKPIAGSPAPMLIRAGKERTMPTEVSTRFGRLDLLKTGDNAASINHEWLGKIDLPANKLISVWDLPNLLPDAAKQKLDAAVLDALKNNSEDAADRLERCLAISHEAIRAGLKELPKAKGAPRLRLILTLFDDTAMPSLPVYRAAQNLNGRIPGGFGAGGGPAKR